MKNNNPEQRLIDIKIYTSIPLSDILQAYPKIKPERANQALNILVKNGHIDKVDHPNFHQILFKATQEGDAAFADGYYAELVTKEIRNSFLIVTGIIGGIWSIVKWVLPLCIQQ